MRLGRRFLLRLARHRSRGRSRSHRRGGWRRRRRFGGRGLRRLGGRLAFRFEHEDRRIPGNLVADLDPDLFHHAGSGGGDFHRCLVRLQRDQRLLLGNRVAGFHQHLDDLDLLEVADIGYANGHVVGRLGLGFFFGFFLCGPGLFFRIQLKDRRALRHLVAHLHLQFLHHAGRGRRYLHRRLVRLQRDQRLLLRNGVARFDEYFDDLDFLEVADVGNNHLTHTVVGSGLSASMPYFFIASATLFALPSPWSASAFRAATVTKLRLTSKKYRSLGRVSERPKPSVPRTLYTRSLGMNGLSWSAKIFM